MPKLPPLNALRAFESAARHGGFVRAAAELNVTPSAVSQQIKLLESHLGFALFERLPRGLRLTQAGQAYLPGIADGFDRMARAAGEGRRQSLAGRLIVTVLPSFASGWLVPRLPRFRARCPDVDLVIRSERPIVDLRREEVDLAIRYGVGSFRGLRSTLLMMEDIFPVCAPSLLNGDRPLRDPRDLRHHALLHDIGALGNEPWVLWSPWLTQIGIAEAGQRPGLHFTDSVQLYQAAMEGQGVALGRSVLIGDHLAAGRLVRPLKLSHRSSYGYYAVTTTAAEGDPLVAAFIAWLTEESATERQTYDQSGL